MLIKLINYKGKYVGLVDKSIAESIAKKEGKDLICINNKLNPKIFKIGDIKKHNYEKKKRIKKKKHKSLKEVRFNTEISENDYLVKIKNIFRFLNKLLDVKILIFKRYIIKKNIIFNFIDRLKKDLEKKFIFNIHHKNNLRSYIINISNAKKK
ncbi:translation initiation factor IF-3 [Candidatus Vidania fulgoroideorum]